MAELAVTAMGPDRPGIVAGVAQVLLDRGGNVLDSAMTILGGRFALTLLVETDVPAEDLRSALAAATAGLDLHLTVSPAGGATEHARPTHLLSVYGEDQPGILAGVTRAHVIRIAGELGYWLEEGWYPQRELAGAEEVFSSSSVRELMPIVRLDDAPVGDGRPGQAAQELQAGLRRAAEG